MGRVESHANLVGIDMNENTTSTTATIQEIIDGADCPLDIAVIPNNMGINLCSVDSISWTALSDGQLTSLTIQFLPDLDDLSSE